MTTETPPTPGGVAEPGLLGSGSTAGIVDMPEENYHRHPALSYSGAKLLLTECPAIYKHRLEHPITKYAWDFGHAAHKLVLGVGADIVEVDADSWRTKAAKDAADQARAEHKVPLLNEDVAKARAMAAVVHAHPLASALFNPERGTPERNLFWEDLATDTPLRARLDWLPNNECEPFILADYKTGDANPRKFSKAAADYMYFMQAAAYSEAVQTLGLHPYPAFLFVVQSKTPPYPVTVIELDDAAMDAGRVQWRKAIDIYRRCIDTDTWPTYSSEVELVSLPYWYLRQLESA